MHKFTFAVKIPGRGTDHRTIRLQQHPQRFIEQRFGAPSQEAEALLNSIGDVQRLERMTDRVLTAADWIDLLSTP